MEKLIVGPLETTLIQTLIIIDALDECKDPNPESAILFVLSKYIDKIPNVKFFITGHPDSQIRSGFRLPSLQPITKVFKLHEVNRSFVDDDIKLFFRTQLANVPRNRSDYDLAEEWPSLTDIDILCEKAAGFFIYASTVIKFVISRDHTPAEQLEQIILLPQSTSHEGGSGIDLLYTQALEQVVGSRYKDGKGPHPHFKTVVGAVLLMFNPLSVRALSDLLRVPNIPTALRSLHSLLLIPTSNVAPIRIFHKSFPDFLTNPQQCIDQWFFIDPPICHREIMLSCLSLMKEKLKKNICNLDNCTIISEVEDFSTYRQVYIADALEYSCRFWTDHLMKIPGSGPNIGEVQKAISEFFMNSLLYWIEALSLIGHLDTGIYALNNILQWYILVSYMEYLSRKHIFTPIQIGVPCKWINDSQCLLLEHFDIIHDSPLQIYHFALPFSPSSSWLRECYTAELSHEVKVVKGLQAEWGACSRTVSFGFIPQALACWKGLVATGLQSGNIIILDAVTGIHTSILSGHTDWVLSLAFSLDGSFLVSGSQDETINLWDVQTGGVVKTFHGHTDWVFSVSISPDNTMIASGSHDNTIWLWNIQTGEGQCAIMQQQCVDYVRFSHIDPQHLTSVSGGKVWQWDINGHLIGPVYDGSHVAFSLDDTLFASCDGTTIIVQSSHSGVVVAELHVAKSYFKNCCFSPNSQLVAGATDSTIYVWDITGSDHHLIETFIGHTNRVVSLVFSSSLISASYDQSVKFWQIGASSANPVTTGAISTSPTSAPIKFVTLQARDGIAISSDSAVVVKIWDIMTGLCKTSFQTPAKGYSHRDVQLIGGRLIFVWYADQKIYIWDVGKDGLQMVDTPGFSVRDLRISGDGSKVFVLTKNSIQAWSMWTGEAMGKVELEGEGYPYLDPLCVYGSRIWVYFEDLSTQGWDFGIPGLSPIPLSSISDRPHLDFIRWPNAKIKNMVTGKVIFQLSGKYADPTDVHWDGQYLVAGYRSGQVLILDFNCMLPQ